MVLKDGAVMSKSKGNVVDPDDMLAKYGADALRLYVMFVAPPEKEVEWSDAGLEGSFRFLVRVWRLVDHWAETIGGEGMPACGDDCTDAERALRRKTHDTIRRVTVDIEERMHLNTAVSSLMELVNELYAFSETTAHGAPTRGEPPVGRVERPQTIAVLREAIDALVVMMSPFAPHTAEELWQMLGHRRRPRRRRAWPSFDPEVAKAEEVVVPVQINGKVRARLTVPAGAVGRRAARAGAGRRRRCRLTRRQDDPEGRGRQGAAGERGGVNDGSDRVPDRAAVVAGLASVLSSCCAALGAGCGYALAGRGSFLPAYIQTIGMPTFTNRTTVFNLETQLTQKVRVRVHRPRHVPDPARGDRRRRAAHRRGVGGRRSRQSASRASSSRRATRSR